MIGEERSIGNCLTEQLISIRSLTLIVSPNKELWTGTVPVNKELLIGTVPVNKDLLAGTVPVNKELLTERVPVNNLFLFFFVQNMIFKTYQPKISK